MFGKLFGKKASAAKAEIKKFENRDLMEATVAVACWLPSLMANVKTPRSRPSSPCCAPTRRWKGSAMS